MLIKCNIQYTIIVSYVYWCYMDSMPSVSRPIAQFLIQAQSSVESPQLMKNFSRLTPPQLTLAHKVISNNQGMWTNYKEGSNASFETQLHEIMIVLQGGERSDTKAGFFSKINLFGIKADELVAVVKSSNQHIKEIHKEFQSKKSYVFEEKTTHQLFHDLMGTHLVTNDQLTMQLWKDCVRFGDTVKIEGKAVLFAQPEESPEMWDALLPQDLKNYLGNDKEVAVKAALMLTQGIVMEGARKGTAAVKDPTLEGAQFWGYNKAPEFNFTKSKDNQIILSVTTKGYLGYKLQEPERNYSIVQEINLSQPSALVRLSFHPD